MQTIPIIADSGVSRDLANCLSSLKALGVTDRRILSDILRTTLERHPEFWGVWTIWEPNALDGRDREFANQEGHDRYPNRLPVQANKPRTAEESLSKREREVLLWVSQGKSNSEIGTILGISAHTVKHHMEKIFSKLGVENRHAAMLCALQPFIQRQADGTTLNR